MKSAVTNMCLYKGETAKKLSFFKGLLVSHGGRCTRGIIWSIALGVSVLSYCWVSALLSNAIMAKVLFPSFIISQQDILGPKSLLTPGCFFTVTGVLRNSFLFHCITYSKTKKPKRSTSPTSNFTKSLASQGDAHLGSDREAIHLDLNSPTHIWYSPQGSGACSLALLRGCFLNKPKALAHLPTKDSLKTYITSNLEHEMKIDAFNSCNNENRKLPQTMCSFIFRVSFQE